MNILPEQFFVSADLNSAFFQLGTVIIIATVFAFLAGKLKQPLIPAYILTGLLLGPIYHLITNKELILSLSEIGIAFLLFIVGLEMDLKKLKSIAAVAGLGATIRSLLMFTLGFIIALFIAYAAVGIVKEASKILCDSVAITNPKKISDIVLKIEGVKACHKIRTRGRPDDICVDLHVQVESTMHIDQAHKICYAIEEAVKHGIPEVSDVLVHIEPKEKKKR